MSKASITDSINNMLRKKLDQYLYFDYYWLKEPQLIYNMLLEILPSIHGINDISSSSSHTF